MQGAVDTVSPALTRDELGWLSTLDDVESRIVFTDRSGEATQYRTETGPFEPEYLQQLPQRDWTLLVHDVEKHLPELRVLFAHVPFIPDWRIDDLMVSFAAPGGGVGPHRDNYDVFLLQGTGTRDWHITTESVEEDVEASQDLALLREFNGEQLKCSEGDVLYLPPGVPHWGTAQRACLTYSIGMRAPQLSDLVDVLPDEEAVNPFYRDPDLTTSEARSGYISPNARSRADELAGQTLAANTLGRFVTLTKDWLRPERVTIEDCELLFDYLARGGSVEIHGMARIAWDDGHAYLNGEHFKIEPETCNLIEQICEQRQVSGPVLASDQALETLRWLLAHGAFDLTAIS